MKTMDWQDAEEELRDYLLSLPPEQANVVLDELAEECAKVLAFQLIRFQVGTQIGLVLPQIRSQLCDLKNLLRQELKDARPRTDYRTASGALERFVAVG